MQKEYSFCAPALLHFTLLYAGGVRVHMDADIGGE